jgi:hypothetical protein
MECFVVLAARQRPSIPLAMALQSGGVDSSGRLGAEQDILSEY